MYLTFFNFDRLVRFKGFPVSEKCKISLKTRLRADWKEVESYKTHGATNVHMMSSLGTSTHRPFAEDEIELASFYLGSRAKVFMGMVNDSLTRIVFEKRAVGFKTDEVNFI